MTQNTVTQMDELEIKRFLFGEMSDEERDSVEEELFENDELFYEIADLENQLVDLYARKKLFGEELVRFERSLANLPERRTKIANAVALQTLIDEERPPEKPVEVPLATTIWQRIADLFKVNTMAFGYSMATMLLVFAVATVFLLIDNRRKSSEIAELQNNQPREWEQKQNELENQLATYNERVEELQKQTDSQGSAGDRISGELENVSEEKERIEKELEQLRKERKLTPTPKPNQPSVPTLATFLLTPSISARGGTGGTSSRNLSVERETKRITMRLVLPDEVKNDEKLSVKLNDKIIASNILSGGQTIIRITISPDDLAEGLNRLWVVDAAGKEISKYIFNLKKK